jgi:hypothetical protein
MAGRVAHVGEVGSSHKILVRKLKANRLHVLPRRRWKDKINTGMKLIWLGAATSPCDHSNESSGSERIILPAERLLVCRGLCSFNVWNLV